MDKFGIFKLLNSFFNLYGQKNQENPQTTNSDGEPQSNPLLSILNGLNNKTPQNSGANNTTNNNAKKTENKPFLPLQENMLSTMNSHDEFVKRVTQKKQK